MIKVSNHFLKLRTTDPRMAATFFSCPKLAVTGRSSASPLSSRREGWQGSMRKKAIVNARKDEYYRGKLVDENMIVLRMRIKEMKMLETGQTTPSNWMEWEKKFFVHYDEDVCEAIGLSQSYLMNTRPSLALGLVSLIALSVPISTSFVVFYVVETVKRFL